jgi:tetratricopeptide (TPR) repeat protein
MKLKSIGLTIVSLLLLIAGNLYSQDQTLEELLAQGDQYYEQFDNQKALEVFQKANKQFPDNWEVLWRLSRTYVDIGEHMPANTSEEEDAQLAEYQKSFDYADKSVKLAPEQPETYLRRAIAGGRIALFKGVFSVGSVVDQVRNDCQKAIELGTGGDFIQAVAHYVLARTHAKLAEKPGIVRWPLGLGWGDIDVALEQYEKAINLDPNYMMIYVDYAKALIEEDEYEKAREVLNKGLKCPIRDEDDKDRIEEAKNLLQEIKDE